MGNITEALMFSGGKDSLACLFLLRRKWPDIYIVWVNTGKNFPEVMKTIQTVREMVPHFVEISTDQEQQNRRNGIPSHLVPINRTVQGKTVSGQTGESVQSYIQCCWENISGPIMDWCKSNEITTVYKGQRLDEQYKGTSTNGCVVDGIQFLQPIENWTKAQVMQYLNKEMDEIPGHLRFDHSSMDCYDCTAFLEHSRDRIAYMKEYHPMMYAGFKRRLDVIKTAIAEEMTLFEGL